MRALIEIAVVAAVWLSIYLFVDFTYKAALAFVTAILVATFLMRMRGESWRDLGLKLPKSISGFLLGTLVFVGVYLSIALAVTLASPWVEANFGAPDRSDYPLDTLAEYLILLSLGWISAAIGEELLLRGFLMNRIAEVFHGGAIAWILALIIQAAAFGSMHAFQGMAGILLTGLVGFVFGVWYLIGRRNLLPLILAHGVIDTVSISALYFGLMPASS